MTQEQTPADGHKSAEAERYTNMLADLIGDESAPPVLRDLARIACGTLDTFAADRIPGSDSNFLDFQLDDDPTPADVRARVPAMIVKLWNWRAADFQPHDLTAPGEPLGIAERSKGRLFA